MLNRKKYKVYPTLLSNRGNGTDNIWLSGSLRLNDNDDVNIIDPQNGDQLIYNGIIDQWENTTTPSQVKHWLTESHQIGGDVVTSSNVYYGGATAGFSGHANWDTPQWTLSLLNIFYFNWGMGRGALRPIPYENVTKIYFNGHIGVPPDNHYTIISIYHHPCVTAVDFSPYTQPLTCIGAFSTSVNTRLGVPYNGMECMNFEIDLIDILGYSLGISDMIIVTVRFIDINDPTSTATILLGSPVMINFNLSLETTDSSLEFNTAAPC